MRRAVCLGIALLVAPLLFFTPSASAQQPSAGEGTCDPARIKPESYRLTTEAQALNALRPRDAWWEPYGIWNDSREIGDLNQGSRRLAERARELDDRNVLADAVLARQYVVMAIDAQKAEAAWQRALDNRAAIAWTASLFDVDPRSFFVVAFDQRGIRVYRFGQLAAPLRTHFGAPEFPQPDRVDFWRALGGCLPGNVAPDVEIPWSAVGGIEVRDRGLRFRLAHKVTITSDRNNRRTSDKLDVILHGQPGDIDFRFAMTPMSRRPIFGRPGGVQITAYEERVRQMLMKFFFRRT